MKSPLKPADKREMKKRASGFALTLALTTLASCGSSAEEAKTIDALISEFITNHSLDGDPVDGMLPPSINSPKADLGKRLFFTKALSGGMDTACASCHHPVLGGGDGLPLPIGVDAVAESLLGPGRTHRAAATGFDGGPTVPRNSPTTFNMALWKQTLFWDGRVESVPGGITSPDSTTFPQVDPDAALTLTATQARFPVTSAEEMRGFSFEASGENEDVRDHLAGRMGNYGVGAGEITEDWLPLFRTAFAQPTGTAQDLITFPNIVEAIGVYEDSQVFIETPWKDYVEGQEDALTPSAKRGALLFFRGPSAGGAACVRCHSGDFFTDERFHAVGFPQIGRGKGDGAVTGDLHADFGRERVTDNRDDRYAFRTPSLINVAATGPWGHDGVFQDLESLVRYHLDPESGWASFDLGALPADIQTVGTVANTALIIQELLAQKASGDSRLPIVTDFTTAQIQDLVAFLEALTDPRVLDPAEMEPWIGRNDATFTDSLLLEATDGALNSL
ncbi:MAG: cytochrome c peroxidase [Planctomycetota bacterium]